jgi:hypothetical protein
MRRDYCCALQLPFLVTIDLNIFNKSHLQTLIRLRIGGYKMYGWSCLVMAMYHRVDLTHGTVSIHVLSFIMDFFHDMWYYISKSGNVRGHDIKQEFKCKQTLGSFLLFWYIMVQIEVFDEACCLYFEFCSTVLHHQIWQCKKGRQYIMFNHDMEICRMVISCFLIDVSWSRLKHSLSWQFMILTLNVFKIGSTQTVKLERTIASIGTFFAMSSIFGFLDWIMYLQIGKTPMQNMVSTRL